MGALVQANYGSRDLLRLDGRPVAFSTGNIVPLLAVEPTVVTTLPAAAMTPLFDATAGAVEESIWNALCAAETTIGHRDRIVHALPHDRLVALR